MPLGEGGVVLTPPLPPRYDRYVPQIYRSRFRGKSPSPYSLFHLKTEGESKVVGVR